MSAALKIAAVAGLLALQTPAWADDGRWVFSTGVDYSTGDYGETHGYDDRHHAGGPGLFG